MRCPFSGMGMGEQRAAKTRPAMKEFLDESKHSKTPPTPSGIPRLHLVDGKTVCKEKLDPDPFGLGIGQAL